MPPNTQLTCRAGAGKSPAVPDTTQAGHQHDQPLIQPGQVQRMFGGRRHFLGAVDKKQAY